MQLQDTKKTVLARIKKNQKNEKRRSDKYLIIQFISTLIVWQFCLPVLPVERLFEYTSLVEEGYRIAFPVAYFSTHVVHESCARESFLLRDITSQMDLISHDSARLLFYF